VCRKSRLEGLSSGGRTQLPPPLEFMAPHVSGQGWFLTPLSHCLSCHTDSVVILSQLSHCLSSRLELYIGLLKCLKLPESQKSIKLFFPISTYLRRFLVVLACVLGSCALPSPGGEFSAWDCFIMESSCTL
jgi:hypothetical protein